MSNDTKPPKGPLLPDPNDPKPVDGKRTNIIDIKKALKERKEERQQKKEAKTDPRQKKPDKPKKEKKTRSTVEKAQSDEPLDPVEKTRREAEKQRKEFNDKKRIERLRKAVLGRFAKLAAVVLPQRKTTAGNNPISAPVHPVISKKATGIDPNVSNDTTKQPDAAQQLQNVLALKKELANRNENRNTSTPTPKPPGG